MNKARYMSIHEPPTLDIPYQTIRQQRQILNEILRLNKLLSEGKEKGQ